MKSYLVSILVQTMGYEKESHLLITGAPEDGEADAFAYACILEAHNDLVDEGHYYSDGDDFAYSPSGVVEVHPDDLPVLSKYLRPFKYDDAVAKSLSLV